MRPSKSEPWRPRRPAPIEFVAHARTLRALAFRDAMRSLFGRRGMQVSGEDSTPTPHDVLL